MAALSNVVLSASSRIQDYEYLYASNTNVSNFVSVKLSGSRNYLLWKAQILCLLDSNNMGGIVDAAFVGPRYSNTEIMRRYDSLVRGWIFGSVTEDVLVDIFNLESAKAVWEKLKSIHDLTVCMQEVNEDANPVEIIVVQDQSATLNEQKKMDQKKKLHEVTVKGVWSKVESILKNDEDLATEAISSDGSSILHMAVEIGHIDLMKKLFSYISDEQVLTKRNSDGSTPLHIAAIVGNKNAAELLVKKNGHLLRIKNHKGELPVHKAYENMHWETVGYLLKAVNADAKTELQPGSIHPGDEIGVNMLVNAISAKQYRLASELVQQFPMFASKSDEVLMAIAKTFPSGNCFILFTSITKKREQNEARKVLKMVCDEIDKLGYSGTYHPYYTRPILQAACHNADEVVHEILKRSPEAIQSTDKNGYDIIQIAIIHRSEKIFNFIYDIGERKNLYKSLEDSSNNNILHLAGKLAPLNVLNQRTRCAILQLQRDLQWQEELKKFVFPTYITKENIFNETPSMVFTREHENLVKEGEQCVKSIAKSCSISAALITTLLFTALITIFDGSDQAKETYLMEKKQAFVVFMISDVISLSVSGMALLVFFSIQTSCFDEEDFRLRLPRRLFIGLLCLLLSTTTMMVSFGAILFLVFYHQKSWMLALICGLAFIPIAFFVTLQMPLMVDLFKSTYLGIFGQKRKHTLQRYPINEQHNCS